MMPNDLKYVVKTLGQSGMIVNHVFDTHSQAEKFINNLFNKSTSQFAYTFSRERLSNLPHYEIG